jgi:thymidylate kinase
MIGWDQMQEDKSSTSKVEIKFQKVGEREKIKPKGAIPLLVWLLLASGVGAGVGQVISSLLGGWLEAKGIQTRMGLAQEKNIKEKLAEIYDAITDAEPHQIQGINVSKVKDVLTNMIARSLEFAEASDPQIANTLITGMLQQGLSIAVQQSLGSAVGLSYGVYRGASGPIPEAIDSISAYLDSFDEGLSSFQIASAGANIAHTAAQMTIGSTLDLNAKFSRADEEMIKAIEEYGAERERPERLLVEQAWTLNQQILMERIRLRNQYTTTLFNMAKAYLSKVNRAYDDLIASYGYYTQNLITEADFSKVIIDCEIQADTFSANYQTMKDIITNDFNTKLAQIVPDTSMITDAWTSYETLLEDKMTAYYNALKEEVEDKVSLLNTLLKDLRAYRSVLAQGGHATWNDIVKARAEYGAYIPPLEFELVYTEGWFG